MPAADEPGLAVEAELVLRQIDRAKPGQHLAPVDGHAKLKLVVHAHREGRGRAGKSDAVGLRDVLRVLLVGRAWDRAEALGFVEPLSDLDERIAERDRHAARIAGEDPLQLAAVERQFIECECACEEAGEKLVEVAGGLPSALAPDHLRAAARIEHIGLVRFGFRRRRPRGQVDCCRGGRGRFGLETQQRDGRRVGRREGQPVEVHRLRFGARKDFQRVFSAAELGGQGDPADPPFLPAVAPAAGGGQIDRAQPKAVECQTIAAFLHAGETDQQVRRFGVLRHSDLPTARQRGRAVGVDPEHRSLGRRAPLAPVDLHPRAAFGRFGFDPHQGLVAQFVGLNRRQ